MANLIIKSSADNLVLQGSDASPAITVGATGTTTFAENATLSGTANNLGTVTAGTIAKTLVPCRPAFSAYSSSSQNGMAQDAWHIIKCNTEIFDTDSAYDNGAASRFTCPSGKAGYYLFTANLRFDAGGGSNGTHDTYAISFRKDNSIIAQQRIGQEPDVNHHGIGISSVILLAVSNYVEVFGYHQQGSGATCTFLGTDYMTNFSGTYLGA